MYKDKKWWFLFSKQKTHNTIYHTVHIGSWRYIVYAHAAAATNLKPLEAIYHSVIYEKKIISTDIVLIWCKSVFNQNNHTTTFQRGTSQNSSSARVWELSLKQNHHIKMRSCNMCVFSLLSLVIFPS